MVFRSGTFIRRSSLWSSGVSISTLAFCDIYIYIYAFVSSFCLGGGGMCVCAGGGGGVFAFCLLRFERYKDGILHNMFINREIE